MTYKYIRNKIIRALTLTVTAAVVMPAAAQSNLNSIVFDPSLGMTADAGADAAADTAVIRPASRGVTASAAPDNAAVGDSVEFSVQLIVPKNTRVIQPETDRGFGDFAVISSRDETRAGKENDRDTVIYRYHLVPLNPDSGVIPQQRFLTATEGGEQIDTLWTAPVPVKVASVIPADIPDSARTLRDLAKQQNAGRTGWGSLWLLLLAAIAAAVYYILERRAKKYVTASVPVVPPKPPYEEAVEHLAELEAKELPQQGKVREYAFELSEIFKRYIGRRFDTIAPELTTEEITAWLAHSELSRETRARAEWFFRTSDHVKYAKQQLDPASVDKLMSEVRAFLESTKPDTELQYERKTQKMEADQT